MITGIIQARMNSGRLWGKTLAPLYGRPLLIRVIERVKQARLIDKLMVATTGLAEDDEIAYVAREMGLECHRGAVEDVLDRFYQCAKRVDASHIVRVMGHHPLADPNLIDQAIRQHLNTAQDLTTNCAPPTFPAGQSVEIIRRKALVTAWEQAIRPLERENITAYILSNRKSFSIGTLTNTNDQSHFRWCIEEADDLHFIEEIYKALFSNNVHFSTQDIMDYLQSNPEINKINAHLTKKPQPVPPQRYL